MAVALLMIAGGTAAGLFGSLLGLGGGVLIVPLLTLVFGLELREAKDEREQRDDEHPAAESEQRTEDAGGSAAGDHQERDRHVGSAAGVRARRPQASARGGYGRRCCGAYGSSAT